jgi:lantibiotic modifying enzyme
MTSFTYAGLDLAHRLAGEAVATPAGVTWHGPDVVGDANDHHIEHGDTGPDLYAGAAGIGLFLAAAARLDEDAAVATVARQAASEALAHVTDLARANRVGLLDGVAGIASAAIEIGRLLGDGGLATEARRTAGMLAAGLRAAAGPQGFDLTSGTAGVVLSLLALAPPGQSNGDGLVEACHAGARSLAETARPEAWGVSWPSSETPDHPGLLGMAHGGAGIGLALAEVAALTDDSRLRDAADAAHEYERSWFSADRGNWPDLREPDGPGAEAGRWPSWPTFWCHGGLGIGLARLRVHQLTGDHSSLAEASIGIEATRRLVIAAGTAAQRGHPTDACLCHGLAGAAEFLLNAAETLGVREHARAADRVGYLILEQNDVNGGRWPCGLRDAGEVPGLFLGLAGIGLTLLRLHDPTLCPSPLLPGPGGRWGG